MQSRSLPRFALLSLAVAAACADDVAIPDTCNGAIELCERAFDEVSYPTAHNAMSNEDDGWVGPNQFHGIGQQLEDGIRGMTLAVHYNNDDRPSLCHTFCELGERLLVDALADISDFLGRQRGEVVTLLFEGQIANDDMLAAFRDSGALGYVYTPDGPGWPTLREMIDANERLVVLDDAGGGPFPWMLAKWQHAWDTPWEADKREKFSCAPDRGDPSNRLFIMNHFLTQVFGVPDEAAQTNGNPYLLDRALECQAQNNALPNFINVDFYSVGDVFETVDSLNGL